MPDGQLRASTSAVPLDGDDASPDGSARSASAPFSAWRVALLILAPAIVGLGTLAAISSGVIVPAFRTSAMEQKKAILRELMTVVFASIDEQKRKADTGVLTEEKAKARALAYLREVRYGVNRKDYFWVHDLQLRMLMHPYRPELDGQDLSEFRDQEGNALFVDMVQKVKSQGDGYVRYRWQWMDDPSREIPKVSYVRLYEPWGWVVGTGVYFDDVERETRGIVRKMTRWAALAAVLVGICAAIAIWQNLNAFRLRFESELALEKANDELLGRNRELSLQGEALRRSEGQYRVLVETMGEAVVSTDADLRITYVNQQAAVLTNHTREEMIGASALRFLDEANQSVLKAGLARHEAGDGSPFELAVTRKDGGKRICLLSVRALTNSAGESIGRLGVLLDLTEQRSEERRRRDAEETARLREMQLLQADKMIALGTLVSGVAHEINNPNHFIQLNASVLKTVFAGLLPSLEARFRQEGEFRIGRMPYSRLRERLPQMLDAILDGSERIKRIVADLRDFVRPSDVSAREEVDVNAVVRSAVNLMGNLIKKSTDHFQLVTGDDLPKILGNSQRLGQVVINLLQNACLALEDRSQEIVVSTAFDPAVLAVLVTVRDAGVGMPEDVIRRIKDPFFTTRRTSGGCGLGLSVSTTIVEQHSGTLEFTSAPGTGTTAVVSLPLPVSKDAVTEDRGEQA